MASVQGETEAVSGRVCFPIRNSITATRNEEQYGSHRQRKVLNQAEIGLCSIAQLVCTCVQLYGVNQISEAVRGWCPMSADEQERAEEDTQRAISRE